MKRRLVFLSVISLAIGIVITSLFMGTGQWKQSGDCADRYNPLPSTVRRVECTGMTYGLPLRFMESEPSVEFEGFSNDPAQITVRPSATTRFDKGNLFLNVAFWSIISIVAIGGGWYWLALRDNKKPEPVTPKK